MCFFRVHFLQEMNKENTQKKVQGGLFYQLQRYQDNVIYFGHLEKSKYYVKIVLNIEKRL